VRHVLYRLERIAGGTLLAVLSLAIFAQVLCRFVFDFPLAWSEEVSRYSFIWLIMVVAPICVREGANISMDMLVSRVPAALARVCELLGFALVLVLLVVLAAWGGKILGIVAAQRSPALGISMAWVYAAVPVGAGLMIIELVGTFWDKAKARGAPAERNGP
jgi:TRAP-type C4-dicarboxylate transport system permease small subunit